MTQGRLAETVGDIRDGLRRGDYSDEAKVSQGIVMRVLNDLDWPVFDTGVVAREYSIKSRRVDYALIGKFGRPAVLLEVKRVGRIEVGEEQLFEYAFHGGAPIVVLTDGRNWWLYFTFGQGDHRDRRFAEVDLQQGDPNRSADLLLRYLQRKAVLDGEARRHAEADLERLWKQRTAAEALPEVWKRLVDEAGGPLVSLVGSRVEDDCGVCPSEETVRRFLRGTLSATLPSKDSEPSPLHERHTVRPISKRDEQAVRTTESDKYRLTLGGTTKSFQNGAKLLTAVFAALANRDPSFCERYQRRYGGSRLPYLARRRSDLYPDHPDLQASQVGVLPGGWFLRTNLGNEKKTELIRWACEVAGVTFGHELRVVMPPVRRRTKPA